MQLPTRSWHSARTAIYENAHRDAPWDAPDNRLALQQDPATPLPRDDDRHMAQHWTAGAPTERQQHPLITSYRDLGHLTYVPPPKRMRMQVTAR